MLAWKQFYADMQEPWHGLCHNLNLAWTAVWMNKKRVKRGDWSDSLLLLNQVSYPLHHSAFSWIIIKKFSALASIKLTQRKSLKCDISFLAQCQFLLVFKPSFFAFHLEPFLSSFSRSVSKVFKYHDWSNLNALKYIPMEFWQIAYKFLLPTNWPWTELLCVHWEKCLFSDMPARN